MVRHLTGDKEVTDANRNAYRELARAGIMDSVGTFIKGDDCVFQLTHQGWERRHEFQRPFTVLCVGDHPQPLPGRFSDRQPCFGRSLNGLFMTDSSSLRMLMGNHLVEPIAQAIPRPSVADLRAVLSTREHARLPARRGGFTARAVPALATCLVALSRFPPSERGRT